MKRIFSILLCISLLAAVLPISASADTASLAEKVLTQIRPRIPDTSIYTDFSSSVSIENDRTVYHFDWSSQSGKDYKNMYLSALENGIITNFGISESKPSSSDSSTGFDRLSVAEAQNRTKELLKILNPDIADKLTLKPSSEVEQFDAKNHTFTITHTEGGISVRGDRGRVTVDINAERITGFSLTYTEGLLYPSPVQIIDLATAKTVFAREIGLDLYYKIWQDNEKKSVKIFPVYAPKTDNLYVNANSGKAEKIIPFSEDVYIKNESADMTPGGGDGSLGLTSAELKEIQNLKKLLTRNAAEDLVRKTKILNITADYTLEEFTTRRLSNIEDLYGHSLVFLRKGDDRDSYIFVDINARTGEVLSFSDFSSADDASMNAEIDIPEIRDRALKALAPQKHTEFKLRESQDNTHYWIYDRFVNGIRAEGNTISIEINANGKLASYRISYTNAVFPMYSDILSNPKASEKFFDAAGYTLLYIPQKSDKALKRPDKAVLIYDLDDYGIYLDPYTGKRINADGTEYTAENRPGEYTDISGHYAEDKIKALKRFGIGFDGAEFKPDDPCLQKDFISLLMGAFGTKTGILIASGMKPDDFYTEAEAMGIIKPDEISPESSVSRIWAAKFLCRALKIEKYAQLDKIFNCPFADVTADKGYVSMLWGLGIVNGTSAKTFSPNDSLTRGQTAILIYNSMNNK